MENRDLSASEGASTSINEDKPSSEDLSPKQREPSNNKKLAELLQIIMDLSVQGGESLSQLSKIIENQVSAIDSLIELHIHLYRKINNPRLNNDVIKGELEEFMKIIAGRLEFHSVNVIEPKLGEAINPKWMKVVQTVEVESANEADRVLSVESCSYQSMIHGRRLERRDAVVVSTVTATAPLMSDDVLDIQGKVEPSPSASNSVICEQESAVKLSLESLSNAGFIVVAIFSLLINIIFLGLYLFSGPNQNSQEKVENKTGQINLNTKLKGLNDSSIRNVPSEVSEVAESDGGEPAAVGSNEKDLVISDDDTTDLLDAGGNEISGSEKDSSRCTGN